MSEVADKGVWDKILNRAREVIMGITREELAKGEQACPECNGVGRVAGRSRSDSKPCKECKGRGTAPDE